MYSGKVWLLWCFVHLTENHAQTKVGLLKKVSFTKKDASGFDWEHGLKGGQDQAGSTWQILFKFWIPTQQKFVAYVCFTFLKFKAEIYIENPLPSPNRFSPQVLLGGKGILALVKYITQLTNYWETWLINCYGRSPFALESISNLLAIEITNLNICFLLLFFFRGVRGWAKKFKSTLKGQCHEKSC